MIANERFGFVATDSGLGTSWSENSYHNRLTPWSNDPIVDPPSEVVYLRDDRSGDFWTATPSPAAGAIKHVTKFGQGYAAYTHRHRGLEVELTAFVPERDPIKILRLRIRNDGPAQRDLSAVYYVDWSLSDTRSRSASHIVTSIDTVCGALFARNAFRTNFGGRIAFIDTVTQSRSMTGDRSSFIGRNGTLSDPLAMEFVHLPGRVRATLNPCGAVQVTASVAPGESIEITFLLGEGKDEDGARSLIAVYRAPGAVEAALTSVITLWNKRLASIEVDTPDAGLNILTNRWLVYQTLGCRLHARSAFYQSGGAFGFRDQLQASGVLCTSMPLSRVITSFVPPAGNSRKATSNTGGTSRVGRACARACQDDRLWLVYAALRYSRVTGDWTIFDNTRPSHLATRAQGRRKESVYETPARLDDEISIYRTLHACNRADDADGHPWVAADGCRKREIGTTAWTKWANRAAARASGLAGFSPPFSDRSQRMQTRAVTPSLRGHTGRTRRGSKTARKRRGTEHGIARHISMTGPPLGSAQNAECRIDSIAQSWSVISGLGDPARSSAGDGVGRVPADRPRTSAHPAADAPVDKAEPSPATSRGMYLVCARTAANTRMPRFGLCSHRQCCSAEMSRTSCSASSIRSTGRPIVTA